MIGHIATFYLLKENLTMNNELLQHEPKQLWEHFENLNAIPRASKSESQVVAFIEAFGKSLGLETQVDAIGNVIIRKPASPGMEDRAGVVLQGHLDMVHQKNSDTQFDFENQGIESWIDGGWLKARGTTLGADNGVGVASMMTVLSSKDLKHGPLEALFTVDEETGMTGAFELKPGQLKGSILLNTDTEEEGELCIGCAGGIDTNIEFSYEPIDASAGVTLKLAVTGLKGGHSGCDIHLGRGNANKVMNRILWTAGELNPQIHSIDGGSLRNAIPRESFAIVVVSQANLSGFKQHVESMAQTIQRELATAEPDLKIAIDDASPVSQVMNPACQQQLLHALYAAPNGVIRMSDQVPGLVETSTSLARVKIENGTAIIQYLSRSSVDSAKIDTANSIAATFRLIGTKVIHQGSYPGWEPKADSPILHIMTEVYQEIFGKQPHVSAVHAGLECGIIGSHYPQMDMISFGPTIKNPHSPDEKCEIASVEKYWRFLVATLGRVPKQNN
jgi:dipeptidase D